MSADFTMGIFPTQLLSFYEVLRFIGFEENDAKLFNGWYDTWCDATDDSEFRSMLYAMGFDYNSIRENGLQYWDSELGCNIDLCVVRHTLLFMITPF